MDYLQKKTPDGRFVLMISIPDKEIPVESLCQLLELLDELKMTIAEMIPTKGVQ